jgi:hypothetical protein
MVGLGKVFFCLETPSSIRIPDTVCTIVAEPLTDPDSVIDPNFEEGIVRIAVSAFRAYFNLQNAALPASLTLIETNAFQCCRYLGEATCAARPQLH